MSTPNFLLYDLFCGAGGASAGYSRAGFQVRGFDRVHSKRYPFDFTHYDFNDFDPADFADADAFHASPPCQRWSPASRASRSQHKHPDFLPLIREFLVSTGKPYVIENVPESPLAQNIKLCGSMFPGLRVRRHRVFELNFPIERLRCSHHRMVHVIRLFNNLTRRTDPRVNWLTIIGGGNYPVQEGRSAMGVPWMTHRELSQSIPPAYTQYIGTWMFDYLRYTHEFDEKTACQILNRRRGDLLFDV